MSVKNNGSEFKFFNVLEDVVVGIISHASMYFCTVWTLFKNPRLVLRTTSQKKYIRPCSFITLSAWFANSSLAQWTNVFWSDSDPPIRGSLRDLFPGFELQPLLTCVLPEVLAVALIGSFIGSVASGSWCGLIRNDSAPTKFPEDLEDLVDKNRGFRRSDIINIAYYAAGLGFCTILLLAVFFGVIAPFLSRFDVHFARWVLVFIASGAAVNVMLRCIDWTDGKWKYAVGFILCLLTGFVMVELKSLVHDGVWKRIIVKSHRQAELDAARTLGRSGGRSIVYSDSDEKGTNATIIWEADMGFDETLRIDRRNISLTFPGSKGEVTLNCPFLLTESEWSKGKEKCPSPEALDLLPFIEVTGRARMLLILRNVNLSKLIYSPGKPTDCVLEMELHVSNRVLESIDPQKDAPKFVIQTKNPFDPSAQKK